MGIRLPSVFVNSKQVSRINKNHCNVPKGHVAVYVGEIQKTRFVVPVSCVNHPLFQALLLCVEEEFGFDHPMGGLTIPCREEAFLDLVTSRIASV